MEDLPEQWKRCMNFIKWSSPLPVQSATWPILQKGRDIVSIAETGSGKTGAFGMPLLTRVKNNRNLQVLILCPTRELAQQAHEVLSKILMIIKIKVALVYGGEPRGKQAIDSRGCEVLVATP